MIRFWLVLGTVFLGAGVVFPQSARSYYDELYRAGGLDRMASEFVCFDDRQENENFFIFGESRTLKASLVENGSYAKLSAGDKGYLSRDWINVRGYAKGVAFSEEQTFAKDGESWLGERGMMDRTPMRMRLTISFETLRYRRTVEILNSNSSKKGEVSTYGRCERIPLTVLQKAN